MLMDDECSICGNRLEEDEKNCTDCGTPLTEEETSFEYESEYDENFD